MDNLTIIEILSRTSAFNRSVIQELIASLKKNINIKSHNNDHLQIRQLLAGRETFVDAQAEYIFTCYP